MDYWGLTVPEDEDEDIAAGTASTRSTPIMPLLKDIRKSHSLLGLDIGGTLAKLVIALPDDEKDSTAESSNNSQALDPIVDEAAAASTRLRNIPPAFGATGQCPPELAFRATLCGRAWRLQFLRGATQLLGGLQLPTDPTASSASSSKSTRLRQVVAAGGGAHKFKALFRSSLGIELVALKEFQSLVRSGSQFSILCVKMYCPLSLLNQAHISASRNLYMHAHLNCMIYKGGWVALPSRSTASRRALHCGTRRIGTFNGKRDARTFSVCGARNE